MDSLIPSGVLSTTFRPLIGVESPPDVVSLVHTNQYIEQRVSLTVAAGWVLTLFHPSLIEIEEQKRLRLTLM